MTATQQPKPETAIAPVGPLARIGLVRFSTPEFLGALVLLLVMVPFLERGHHANLIESVLMTVVLTSAVLAVGRRRRTLITALVLLVPALVSRWGNHYWPDLVSPAIFPACGVVFVAFIVWQFLRFILRAPRVNTEVLCAGISTYLLLGLLWMFGYMLVAQTTPDAFAFNAGPAASHTMSGFNAYYFSFVTLSTIGYGDVTPVSNAARALAVLEGMGGTLYVAVLIARLVALYSSETMEGGRPGSRPPEP